MSAADVLRCERAERMLTRAVQKELDLDEDRENSRSLRLQIALHTIEAQLAAMLKLLVSKGTFTRNEYEGELAPAMEQVALDAVQHARQRLSYLATTNFDDPP